MISAPGSHGGESGVNAGQLQIAVESETTKNIREPPVAGS